ncbi:MAG: Fic family protein [Candidatus Methanoperedens sp.]|nr:Fic family protein [Candidatus Methanoperedens sp.]
MKIPESPPKISYNEIGDALKYLKSDPYDRLIKEAINKYLYWSEFKYRPGIDQIEPEVLWAFIKINRNLSAEKIRISDIAGFEFKYNLTTYIQQKLHEFDLNLGGRLGGEEIIPGSDKDRYLISSIMEEAIASSQLEGAATTREEAKKMLRQERKPINKSEQMILNNYNTIKKLNELKGEKLTIELILEIHSSITKDTLIDPDMEGQFRRSNDIVVVSSSGEVVYIPPVFEHLEKIMRDFCIFANESNEKDFIHPIIRATILHFLIGYIHPFPDGNGRTARAIFYWYLLKEGYWLIEYVSISRMIIKSRAQYARAYLYSELDENDLTYFINYQLKTMGLAFDSLKEYIGRKIKEKRELYDLQKIKNINERQILIIKSLTDEPEFTFTIKEIQNRFNTAYQTARTDIISLEKYGLIEKNIVGKKKLMYYRSENFDAILKNLC